VIDLFGCIGDLPRITGKVLFRPVIALAGLNNNRYSGCGERQVTGPTRSYRKLLYAISLKDGRRPFFTVPSISVKVSKVLRSDIATE